MTQSLLPRDGKRGNFVSFNIERDPPQAADKSIKNLLYRFVIIIYNCFLSWEIWMGNNVVSEHMLSQQIFCQNCSVLHTEQF